ncbi:unnamed protein product [Mytilus edulis]|uniref:Uncharacterized protein n=1 Tax=Mytilus edulis TaxID=6550 RepID=A0A8S3VKU1_MYTED|nr:unnamed protein product [Mytilus edulis]
MSRIGLSENHLSTNCIQCLKNPLQNGLVYELFGYAKRTTNTPTEAVANYLSQLLGIDCSSIPIPALNTKINRLCNNYRSKGGKGRVLLLQKEFVVPTITSSTMSAVEASVLSEFSAQLQCAESTVEKQQCTIANLRKRKKDFKEKYDHLK